jgi:hypothetical protein
MSELRLLGSMAAVASAYWGGGTKTAQVPPAGSFSYGHHVPQGRQSHHSFTRVEAAAGAAPAASQQWNARIAKTNRKSRFRDALSTVDFEEETIPPLSDLVAPVSLSATPWTTDLCSCSVCTQI